MFIQEHFTAYYGISKPDTMTELDATMHTDVEVIVSDESEKKDEEA